MNFKNILNQIAETDPEVYERTSERRDVIKNFTRGVALTALPFAIGGLFKKAYGQSTQTIVETLNFALTLEYLEAEYYNTAIGTSGLIPAGAATSAIQTIRGHENSHVTFLKNTISGLGSTPVIKPTFDFSGGQDGVSPQPIGNGPFGAAFSNYSLFLAVAQVFEDTGVRAYKGQAGNLMSNNEILTAALDIHSVEARHAAHLREMRRANGGALVSGDVRPWIVGNNSNVNNNLVDASYAGEEATTVAGVLIPGINGEDISTDEATGAFDQILTKDQVLDIVKIFIVP